MTFSDLYEAISKLTVPEAFEVIDILSRQLNLYDKKDKMPIHECGNHNKCFYCSSQQIVKNGKMKNGNQKDLCINCRKSFSNSSVKLIIQQKKHIMIGKCFVCV